MFQSDKIYSLKIINIVVRIDEKYYQYCQLISTKVPYLLVLKYHNRQQHDYFDHNTKKCF